MIGHNDILYFNDCCIVVKLSTEGSKTNQTIDKKAFFLQYLTGLLIQDAMVDCCFKR